MSLDARDFMDVIEKKIRKRVEPETEPVCIICGQPSSVEVCPECEEKYPIRIKGVK